ncbi:MAG: DUF3316 domain-containing protein [Dysgonamonadaceae bacterium]|jgi:hypothetical protein|nr:DUF3316 domain-containing protein [Dysgonamonadaceae bacterium]
MKSQVNNGYFNGLSCKAHILLLLFWGYIGGAVAQPSPEIPLIYESDMVGIGSASVYDTYLSPLEYKGVNFGALYEQMEMTGWLSGRIVAQQLLFFELSTTENLTGTASNYAGNLEYSYGLYYRFKPVHRFRFFAGMQADALLGFIYNSRNGNNPATAKVNLNLNLSGMATYHFRIKRQPVQLRYQLNLPAIGSLFSPQFGQSYYEIGLGDGQPLFHLASFHNQRIINQLFSIELPLHSSILRLAYVNRLYETQINSLDTRTVSHSFYVGFSKNFYVVKGKENKKNYRYVF